MAKSVTIQSGECASIALLRLANQAGREHVLQGRSAEQRARDLGAGDLVHPGDRFVMLDSGEVRFVPRAAPSVAQALPEPTDRGALRPRAGAAHRPASLDNLQGPSFGPADGTRVPLTANVNPLRIEQVIGREAGELQIELNNRFNPGRSGVCDVVWSDEVEGGTYVFKDQPSRRVRIWAGDAILTGPRERLGRAVPTQAASSTTLDGRPQIEPGSKILVVGDSLGVGLTPHLENLYGRENVAGASFGGAKPVDWGLASWNGGDHVPRLEQLQNLLATHAPQYVFVSVGANGGGGQTADDVRLATNNILDAIVNAGATPIVIEASPITAYNASKPPVVQEVSKQRGLANAYFATGELFSELPLADGVHPTDSGYREWAERIFRHFR